LFGRWWGDRIGRGMVAEMAGRRQPFHEHSRRSGPAMALAPDEILYDGTHAEARTKNRPTISQMEADLTSAGGQCVFRFTVCMRISVVLP
jgi:hypothetical protein